MDGLARDLPAHCLAETLVLGCGNDLLGDDGFGPALVDRLLQEGLPGGVLALDTGMGVTRLLFDVALSPRRPRRLIVADAVRLGRTPGTVSLLPLDAIAEREVRAISAHQEPTSCLLKELGAVGGIEVWLLAVEPERMPEEVSPGLSPAVQAALPVAGAALRRLLAEEAAGAGSGRGMQAEGG